MENGGVKQSERSQGIGQDQVWSDVTLSMAPNLNKSTKPISVQCEWFMLVEIKAGTTSGHQSAIEAADIDESAQEAGVILRY